MLERNIYNEVCLVLDKKSKILSDKLKSKLEKSKDPLHIVSFIETVVKQSLSIIEQKTISMRLINDVMKVVEKKCNRKIFSGGGEVGIPFYSSVESGMNCFSEVENKEYGTVDFENAVAKQQIDMIGGCDCEKMTGGGCDASVSAGLGTSNCSHMTGGGKSTFVQLISRMIMTFIKEKKKRIDKNAKYMLASYIHYKIICGINSSVREKKLLKFATK